MKWRCKKNSRHQSISRAFASNERDLRTWVEMFFAGRRVDWRPYRLKLNVEEVGSWGRDMEIFILDGEQHRCPAANA